MEKYLINPLWIYLFDVLSDIELTLVFGVIVMCIILFVFSLFWILEGDFIFGEKKELPIQFFKKSIIGLIVAFIIMAIIPSEKTMYTMFVASYITEENLNSAKETVTDVVDYIFEKVDELQGE